MLKKENIKSICSIDTYDCGQKLCKKENIRKVNVTKLGDYGIKATALVKGNFGFFHSVKISLNPEYRNIIESYNCNCYEYTVSKGPCRHCIAFALALAEDADEDFGFRLKPSQKIDIKKKLEPEMKEAEKPLAEAVSDNNHDAENTVNEKDGTLEKENEEADLVQAEEAGAIPPEAVTETPEAETAEMDLTEKEPGSMEIVFGTKVDYESNTELITEETLEDENEGEKAEEQRESPFCWYPNDTTKVFHTNTGIIGTMGTGKTQFTKSLITQLYRQQKNNFYGNQPLGILIFDYKGDYNNTKEDFVRATNAKVLKLHHLPFNPLAIFPSKEYKPLLPVHTANTFKDTISKAFRLGPKQQTALYSCIMDAYENMGITAADQETWGKNAPTFDMVYEVYEKNENIIKTDSLAAAMQKIHAFQLFEPKPYSTASLFDILQGVVVIDLSGYDPDLQSLVVAITLDQFYSQMHAMGSSNTNGKLRQLTKLILVDEADNFMREDFSSLKKIMKEGREFGVGTVLSTQFLDHFVTGEDNYSKYILTWVVHNVSDLKKADIEYVFKTKANSPEAEQLYQRIKGFERFHSVVKVGNEPVNYIRDKAFFELMKEE